MGKLSYDTPVMMDDCIIATSEWFRGRGWDGASSTTAASTTAATNSLLRKNHIGITAIQQQKQQHVKGNSNTLIAVMEDVEIIVSIIRKMFQQADPFSSTSSMAKERGITITIYNNFNGYNNHYYFCLELIRSIRFFCH